uniref:Uncharacterized protein n=1 Tax=Anguilla anguilla TaxID=7936 RepID=A0A0E9RKU8_ANGAN
MVFQLCNYACTREICENKKLQWEIAIMDQRGERLQ